MSENVVAPSSVAVPVQRATWVGWTWALTGTVCFSVSPIFAKLAYAVGLSPTTMLFLRFCLTIALLGGTLLLTAPHKLRMDRRGLVFALTGGLATGVSMLAFFWALTRLEASIASMIFSVYPLAVLGLLALRGEKFTYRHTVRLALGISGVCLLIGPGGTVDLFGVALVLISMLASSVQSVFVQWYLRDYDGIAATLYMVIGINVVVASRWWFEGASLEVPGWQGWAAIIALAVISTYLARLLWFSAVRHIGGGQTAMLVPLETLLTVMWSVLFLRETLSGMQIVGGGLILLSALLASQRMLRARWLPPLARGR